MNFLRLRNILATGLVSLTMILGVAAAMPMTAAACGNGTDSSKDLVLNGVGETGGSCDSSGVTNTVKVAIDILSAVVGMASVIMIILSGFKYVTSNGDSGKVGAAKTTLIYALVGLAIVALTQLLVSLVLSTATGTP